MLENFLPVNIGGVRWKPILTLKPSLSSVLHIDRAHTVHTVSARVIYPQRVLLSGNMSRHRTRRRGNFHYSCVC